MSSSNQNAKENSFMAKEVTFTSKSMAVNLKDGRQLIVPLSFYPTLEQASPEQRENVEIFGEGTSLYFRELDEYISIEALMLGKKELKN